MEPETKVRDRSPKAGMDQPARETAGVLKVKEVEAEVVGGSEDASAPQLLAHPCSLLQLLLSACAGCLGLLGYSDDDPKPATVDDDLKSAADDDGPKPATDDDDPKPAADDDDPKLAADDDDPKHAADDDDDAAAPAVAETPQEGAGGGGDEAASYLYLQEVGTRVRRTSPSPPGTPGEGSGGDGGKHN